MRIFINDIPVRLIGNQKEIDLDDYHKVIDATNEKISSNKLVHHVLIKDLSISLINELLDILNNEIHRNLYSLTIICEDYPGTKLFLKSKYKVVKAAGGLVRKNGKTLMIYRLKKWDLPKGKLEKGETKEEGAVREVEEECGIKVKIGAKICTTRHTYTMNNKSILKKTYWYIMDCVSDKAMTPQLEEDIEEVKWMKPKDVYHALKDSYLSINHVFRKYNKTAQEKEKIYNE